MRQEEAEGTGARFGEVTGVVGVGNGVAGRWRPQQRRLRGEGALGRRARRSVGQGRSLGV